MNSGWWDCEASARGIRWKAVHGDCKPFLKTPMPRAWQLDGRHWLDTEELLIGKRFTTSKWWPHGQYHQVVSLA